MKLLSWMAAIEIRKRATKKTDKSRHLKRTDFPELSSYLPPRCYKLKYSKEAKFKIKNIKNEIFLVGPKVQRSERQCPWNEYRSSNGDFLFFFSAEGDILHFSPEKCIPWGVNNFDIFTIACPERNLNSV